MTVEDLGYKSGIVKKPKLELKKDDKVNKIGKYVNDLMYNSVHNFNKYNRDKAPSIDSKFNTLNNFYKGFKKLEIVKSQTNIALSKMHH